MVETVDNTTQAIEALASTKDRIDGLTLSTNAFATAMTRAFTQATAGGKSFGDVLRQLALQISGLAVAQAFRPIATGISGQIGGLFSGFLGSAPGGGFGSGMDRQPSNITVQVQTPDLGSFRRSEAYLSGQIARAVARGQRSL